MFLDIMSNLDYDLIYKLINILVVVVIVFAIPGIPILMWMTIMYLYRRLKKYINKEDVEADKIIVARAEKNAEITLANDKLLEQNIVLEKENKALLKLKKKIENELDISEEPEEVPCKVESEEQIDLSNMTVIKELRPLAKALGITNYSALNKDQLQEEIKKLPNSTIKEKIDALSLDKK